MNKIIPIIIGLLICLCPHPVYAAGGSIEVHLPEGMEGETVTYIQGENKWSVVVDENRVARAQNLEEGTYQIGVPETSEYTFTVSEISIPTWNEEEKNMQYDVTVIPKYVQKEKQTPLTADFSNGNQYISIGVISLIILMIMSCHNHFKCDTILGKYSKNGGCNNGNDNDTENPRCTRRIGLSSPGSID